MAEEIKVLCPWCNRGEVYIEGAGNANVSIKCPRCQHCFKLRLNDCVALDCGAPCFLNASSIKFPFHHTPSLF